MKKLFYDDAYISSWEAHIEKVEIKNGKYYIVLSETAFYPEAGGQPSDSGTIDGINVLDVVENNGIIYHVLDKIPENKKVKCQIDFQRRFDHMQQHSGQHILSSIFYSLYNGRTAGFHLGEDYVTIDIDLPEISNEMIKNVENEANERIYKNLEIKTYILNYEDALSHQLRKLPPSKDNIRIVEIENTDCTPCCGTHVKRTGEIEIIKILKTEKYKGMTRIYFKCGKRAFYDYQNKHDIILNLNRILSCKEDEILERLNQKEILINQLSLQLKKIKETLIELEVSDILKNTNNSIICKMYCDKSFDEIQRIAKSILEKGDYTILFLSVVDNRILLGHNGNFSTNCGLLFKENIKSFNGQGGGNEKQAQGGFKIKEDAINFYKFLKEKIV